MKLGEVLFLAVGVGIAGAGLVATARASGPRRVRTAPARWTIATNGLRAAFGPVGAFYGVVIASVFPLILITWPLGSWTRHKPLTTLNLKVLHAYDAGRNHTITSAMKLLTQMGNWYQIVTVALVASALLALASKTKRWLPPLVIITTLLGERYLQKAITAICKVHHPPTDLGTYPSGGVARLVCIYGIVGFMALRVLAPRSRRALVGGLWLLTLLTWIESYSRIHLQKHWFFDPIGGLILGAGILAVAVAASSLLPWAEAESEAESVSAQAASRAGRRRRQRRPLRVRLAEAGRQPVTPAAEVEGAPRESAAAAEEAALLPGDVAPASIDTTAQAVDGAPVDGVPGESDAVKDGLKDAASVVHP